MASPALPWEVIERVIDHCSNSIVTLYSFTLTCRDLNPRSTIVLLRRVSFKNRAQIFSFCDVLNAKPHLRHVVRAITVPLTEFSPHPLLRLLENVSEIEFNTPATSVETLPSRSSVIHPCVLTYCRVSAHHIQSLDLRRMTLSSFSALSRLLLSFRTLEKLLCLHLKFKEEEKDLEAVVRVLSQRLRLERLTVQIGDDAMSLRPLNLLGQAAKHSVQRLQLYVTFEEDVHYFYNDIVGLLPSSDWVQLTSVVLRFPLTAIKQIANILNRIGRPATLQKILIEFRVTTLKDMVRFLHSEPSSMKRPALETALLQFPQPHVLFSLLSPLNVRSPQFWRRQFEEYFPVLRKRNAVSFNAKFAPGTHGHDSRITTPIAISSDSRWAATGSDDDTIIIWDLRSGTVSQEWLVRIPANRIDVAAVGGLGPRHLNFLSFSPDNQYLLSTGLTPGVTVWNIHRGVAFKVASLGEEHGVVHRCVWSPDGDFIVAKFNNLNGMVCTWEATTLRLLGAHRTGHGALRDLSPDGRWLLQVTAGLGSIWDVMSGELHRELRVPGSTSDIVAGAFNPHGTQIAAGYSGEDSSVRIWDVDTGRCSLVLSTLLRRTDPATQCQRVEYSPDGGLVLSVFNSPSGSRICIWDAVYGPLLNSLEAPGFGDLIHSCFSPCSTYVASISGEGSVVLWCIRDVSKLSEVCKNGSPVEHIAITPNGKILCYGCDDGTVSFCDIIDLDLEPNATEVL